MWMHFVQERYACANLDLGACRFASLGDHDAKAIQNSLIVINSQTCCSQLNMACMKYKAIAVEGAIWPTALTGCKGLAGSAL